MTFSLTLRRFVFKSFYEEVVDYTFLHKTIFLLLYENLLFTFCFIFVIEYGAVIIVVIFRTKVFIKAICKVIDNPGPLSSSFQKGF